MPLSPSALWAVVPIKELWKSKRRLRDVLFADERERLVRAMLEDVLRALMAVPSLADVLVVTRDGGFGELARERGAEVIAEEGEGELNDALALAASHLGRIGAAGMLVVPGDVPAITPREIQELIDAHGPAPAVTLVPDRRGQGTNALAASPPELCPFLFGEESFERHVEAAGAAGVEARIVDLAGLRHDVDTEQDLDDLSHLAPGSATAEVLRSLGRFVDPTAELAASEDFA